MGSEITGRLAIVIPAYQARFLSTTLASLAGQSVEDTRLYIFDDHSPQPIEALARAALSGSGMSWSYERFEQNLGGVALTRHYDRCVKRITEPWIWLFSDDDVMEPGCVAAFRQTLRVTQGRHDVYCFDAIEIDADDQITALRPPLPDWESWKQHAYFLFCGCRVVPQQAVVFSKAAYDKLGAFVEFPLAWMSDFASLMAMAAERGIHRIPGPRVRFRQSGQNISSSHEPALSAQKLQAAMQFTRWVMRRIENVPDHNFPLSDESLQQLACVWFERHLVALHRWHRPSECLQTARFLADTCREPYSRALARMLMLNAATASHTARRWLFRSRQPDHGFGRPVSGPRPAAD